MVAQKPSRESCPGLRTLVSLCHDHGQSLSDDPAAADALGSGHGCHSCCHPTGYLRGSLCGLLFRVQGTAPDWLSPGHMSKPCL